MKNIIVALFVFITCTNIPVMATKYGSITIRDGENTATVTDDGALLVSVDGHVDTLNSTSTALTANDTFVGSIINVEDVAVIMVSVFSDKASKTDGFKVEFSTDSINFDNNDVYTIPKNTGKVYSFSPAAKYYRIQYINGDTAQTVFRLQSSMKKNYVKPSSHRVHDAVSNQDDAELVKAVISGEDENGVFQNVQTTEDGNLTISDNSNGLSIAMGKVTGASFIHKFGNAPDFDATDGLVTIWDGADDGHISAMKYVYSTSANINKLSSDNAADSANVEIQGLNSDTLVTLDTVKLLGTAKVTSDISFLRVFRMRNLSSKDNTGHIYCYVDCAITAGTPTKPDSVRAIIQPSNNQTEMAVYTIPKNKVGYMRSWYASISGGSKTSNYVIELRARPPGISLMLKHRSALSETGTSYVNHEYVEPEVFLPGTDIELRTEATAVGVTAASVSGGFDIVLIDK